MKIIVSCSSSEMQCSYVKIANVQWAEQCKGFAKDDVQDEAEDTFSKGWRTEFSVLMT